MNPYRPADASGRWVTGLGVGVCLTLICLCPARAQTAPPLSEEETATYVRRLVEYRKARAAREAAESKKPKSGAHLRKVRTGESEEGAPNESTAAGASTGEGKDDEPVAKIAPGKSGSKELAPVVAGSDAVKPPELKRSDVKPEVLKATPEQKTPPASSEGTEAIKRDAPGKSAADKPATRPKASVQVAPRRESKASPAPSKPRPATRPSASAPRRPAPIKAVPVAPVAPVRVEEPARQRRDSFKRKGPRSRIR